MKQANSRDICSDISQTGFYSSVKLCVFCQNTSHCLGEKDQNVANLKGNQILRQQTR